MARQRRSQIENKVDKSTNSSSSNGSNPAKQIKTKTGLLSYWKVIIGCICLAIAIFVGYLGYLETRVNTPYDDRKMVVSSGLDKPERFWGSYRPGLYFGLKSRDPHSLLTGLMWYFPKRLKPGGDGTRHWCEQSDGLEKYGWLQHDGSTFGIQEIQDGPFIITTSFVKRLGGLHGGDWTARVLVDYKTEYANLIDEEVSLLWYTALEESGKNYIKPSNFASKLTGVRGETDGLGSVNHESYLSTNYLGLDLLKETVISSLRLVNDKTKKQKRIVLAGDILGQDGTVKRSPNFIATQVTGSVPFSIDVVFESGSFGTRQNTLAGDIYTNTLSWHSTRFSQRFEDTFGLKTKGYGPKEIDFAQAALSNMIGGIGYFYGASRVQSVYTKDPVPYWKAPLYTAVPSRCHIKVRTKLRQRRSSNAETKSIMLYFNNCLTATELLVLQKFFPRGFLWDEGFHGLLIGAWDLDVELDIICHWFDLMNVEGWIPREQILGVEALAKVPQEFVTQKNTNANPPTFFLTLEYILRKYEDQLTESRRTILQRLYPRLQAWFTWFNTTQKGSLPSSYRWRGRDAHTNRELNPKTLTSGLDDYPRASHPTDDEMHIDLRCWIAIAANVMSKLADLLGRDGYKYEQTSEYLSDNEVMNKLHWSDYTQQYADYGYHTDSVELRRPKPSPRSQQTQSMEMVRVTLKDPEYRLIDSTFGYVSLFPFFLQLINPDSPKLRKILDDMENPNHLWTNYGLRSLSKTSPLYMKRNSEHDPPYWRGQIWMNMNFLAIRALHYYANTNGLYSEQANKLYNKLRQNVIENLMTQYYRTGYLWEQYSDKTGEGSGCKPFNGWTALVVLIMGEHY